MLLFNKWKMTKNNVNLKSNKLKN